MEKDYILWLNNIEGVGIKTIEKLLDIFGTAENVFTSSTDKLHNVKGIKQDTIHNIEKKRDYGYINNLKNTLKTLSIDVLYKNENDYPEHLKNIYDSPYILYKRGKIKSCDMNAIAIVGARKASPYGKWVAYKFAGELAQRGITVISGMAYGIDTAAHKGALDSGGRTIAVMGCGLDICYPKSNFELMQNIEKSGAVLSEYAVGVQPIAGNFPARNRIISGLAKGVLVVEASENSGSLITTEFALEQGREVFAIPGNINSSLSKGSNKLIKEGAKITTCVEDILEELNISFEKQKSNKELSGLSGLETEILKYIDEKQPVSLELALRDLNISVSHMYSIITILQLKGLIEQLPGKILIVK